ncbi:MAG: hypothetical protein R2762_03300 [Bryobacteraceae bacterium]
MGGLADVSAPRPAPPRIELPLDWLTRKLGHELPASEVRRITEALAFTVDEIGPGVFSVGVPSWRATKDISLREDLVEEVGHMLGYESIPPAARCFPPKRPLQPPTRVLSSCAPWPRRRGFHRGLQLLIHQP